ncbi:hypothetical protein MWU78_16370 [Arenibacter sp. F26102]|uniref:hypothetical protein n=1 Tax=Arenibacter sp. F26102 TaxID=2926416 RepID=UPI001FF1282E|nr:hypothetical protein [Arenibacter sp. F26102]MCK0147235.1 hypothetical protein [Arenibacter sp. F26102]
MTRTNHLIRTLFISGLMLTLSVSGFSQSSAAMDDNFRFAKLHQDYLKLSVYITAHSVERLLSTPEGRREATSLMMANGITKVYLEVYRGGLVVAPSLLAETTTYFTQNGFEVVGGIATVPGGDIGVKQEGELGWFNWQNPKTQQDMKKVMLDAAPIFDTFIVDDFLCTGDISLESKAAKGDRSWSDYRRQLMTELASSIFIDPAKSINPDIHMIIKYPQWYDRFHMFGYDVETGPKLFDEVWVGTETRGQYTQRFGFVQPYEGFVNYSWIKSLAGKKIGGAWFDHGDCDALDFVEQAYQSVLAGANELVMFNYGSFVNGHAGHHLLRMDFEKLARLAKTLKTSPIHGVAGYKPPHSDAGGDLYIMDFIGMFGIPLIPTAYYPEDAATIFLPTQAAADPNIVGKVVASHKQGKRIIMTAGFLATVDDNKKLSKLAGILKPEVGVVSAEKIILDGSETTLERPLDIEATMEIKKATALLEVKSGNSTIPYLTKSKDGQVYVLNTHTFSEADFKAVGEVLLCPRPLGLLDLPTSWANVIRTAFNEQLKIELNAPTRITMQPMENGDLILHNYNKEEVELQLNGLEVDDLLDAFTGQKLDTASGTLKMKPRSRLWLENTH